MLRSVVPFSGGGGVPRYPRLYELLVLRLSLNFVRLALDPQPFLAPTDYRCIYTYLFWLKPSLNLFKFATKRAWPIFLLMAP